MVERRTYFTGVLKGKYYGELDSALDNNTNETIYNFSIYEAQVDLHKADFIKWNENNREPLEKFNGEKIYQAPLPPKISIHVLDLNKTFLAEVWEPKIIFENNSIYNHQTEDKEVFGEIEAKFSAYFKHEEEVIEYLDEPSNSELPVPDVSSEPVLKYNNSKNSNKFNEEEDGHSGKNEDLNSQSCLSSLGDFLGIILLLCVAIPLLIYAWPIVLIFGVFLLGSYLISLFSNVFRFLGNIVLGAFGILLLGLFIGALVSAFNGESVIQPRPIEATPEVVDNDLSLEPPPTIYGDSIISHHRNWQDYSGNNYAGIFKVRFSDFNSSNNFRNNYPDEVYSENDYNKFIAQAFLLDKQPLTAVYHMLDSINATNRLTQQEFAEVIVSSVQHIPYTLLLDKSCSYSYNDEFIRDYLQSGEECIGNVRFGILNPAEFIATLKGDCDTRTVFLFTLLNHFGFDVAILGSRLYAHSIIGINLPYQGTYKLIKGKKYYVWETTGKDFAPGQLPREISNMNHWTVNLINK